MKKYLLLFAISVVTILKVSAQDTLADRSNNVKFGIKGGINIANVVETPTPTNVDYNNWVGITAGIFLTIPFDKNFALQPEFLYSQMGSTVSSSSFVAGSQILTLTYLNIPVLFKYSPTKSIGFVLGPQIGFLNSAKINSTSAFLSSNSNDFSSNVKKNDFSGVVGAQLNLSGIAFLSARYQLGLSNVSNSADGSTDKNNCFTFTIDLLFSR